MNTFDAIQSRRNVRQFTDAPLADHDLEQILEAGRRAPSANNWQPWDFVLVTDRATLGQLAKVWQGAGHVAHAAAAIAIVASLQSDPRREGLLQYDLGQATMSMMIAAADLGIGTAHASVAEQDLARSILGHPADRFCAYLMSLGYPADRPLSIMRHPKRRPFDELVHRGHW